MRRFVRCTLLLIPIMAPLAACQRSPASEAVNVTADNAADVNSSGSASGPEEVNAASAAEADPASNGSTDHGNTDH